MGGSSKSQTVGYRYYLGIHMVLSAGPIDKLTQIKVDKKLAWSGDLSSGAFFINALELFGGDKREGGISGLVDFLPGNPDQGTNAYLVSKLGALIPDFIGAASLVLNQVYLGNNPYLKNWSARCQRIHVTGYDANDVIEQWYDEKSAIQTFSPGETLYFDDSTWKYLQISFGDASTAYAGTSYDDSAWASGQMPFGFRSWLNPLTALGRGIPKTIIPRHTHVWVRRTLSLPQEISLFNFTAFIDNGLDVYVNGVLVKSDYSSKGHILSFGIPGSAFVVGDNVIACKIRSDGTSHGDAWFDWKIPSGNEPDMNPAHIIRECLTNDDWGMGYSTGDIDDDAFTLAADQLFDEEFGMSLLWDRQTEVIDFVNTVLRHIDATLFIDRVSGKFVLKLIRDDYDENDLITLNEDNVDKVEDYKRSQFGELTTSVSVEYWDKSTGTKAGTIIQDIALEQMQNNAINVTLQYPGITTKTIAARVAQRDLRTLSGQPVSCTVYADRTAKDLQAGSVFILDWPEYQVNDPSSDDPQPVVMRVTGVAYGDGKVNRIRLTCVEDIFSMDDAPLIPVEPPIWTDPVEQPLPVEYRLPFEIPYLELVQNQGQTLADALIEGNPDVGFVGIAGRRPSSGAVNAKVWTNPGSGYSEKGLMDFPPFAFLGEAIDRMETVFDIYSLEDKTNVVLGTWFQIGDELMCVVDIEDTFVEVKRGCLDTVPAEHAVGEAMYFWDRYLGFDQTEYVIGEDIDIKLLTSNGGTDLAIADAPVDTLEIVGRVFKPYPPGNLKINDEYFPIAIIGEPTLTWTHRDRLQQTGGTLVGFTEASIGPEAGTTYTLRIYDQDDNLVRTETGISGTTYTYDTADEATDGGPFVALRFELESVRDGAASFQFHSVRVERTEFGSLVTADNEARVTTDGKYRATA